MQEISMLQNNRRYDLRNQNAFAIPFSYSTYNSTKAISYLDPNIREVLPDNLKSIISLSSFKEQIRKRNPENCPRRLCEPTLFIHGPN